MMSGDYKVAMCKEAGTENIVVLVHTRSMFAKLVPHPQLSL